jgi:hypothetical protein
MRLCERSEAISLAWGPLPGDCRVAGAPRNDGCLDLKYRPPDLMQSNNLPA